MLQDRLRRLIDFDEEQKQRRDQEQAFRSQLGTGGKALAGRNGDGNQRQPKADGDQSLSGASATAKAKEQLSNKDRQISALAGQLKKAGLSPEFPKRSPSVDKC